jgi:hypothetical protein
MNKLRFIRRSTPPLGERRMPLQNSSGDFLRQLGTAVQANPLAATLIGLGVVWLFAGERRMSLSRRGAHPTPGKRY